MNKINIFLKSYGSLILIIFFPIGLIILMNFLNGPNTKQQVHWHSEITYNLCGDATQLIDSGQHGKIHGHDDNKAHIEGIIDTAKRTETLGAFFNAANIKFSQTKIGKYKNGDKCNGSDKEGKVSVIVNGKENLEFRNYILNNKDEIKIIFK